MSEITFETDGGAAFPAEFHGGEGNWRQEGMSLRDWFAGQAMMGGLAEYANPASTGSDARPASWHAARAYEIADAMLAERGRR